MWTIILALMLTSLFVPASVFGEIWCVPGPIDGTSCPKVSTTIKGALDALPVKGSHVIKVGAGNPPERIVVTKRAQIRCFGDAVIRDRDPVDPEPIGTPTAKIHPDTATGPRALARRRPALRVAGPSPCGPPGNIGCLVEYVGPLTLLGQSILNCKLDVYSSGIGIYVPHDVAWFKLESSTLSRIGEQAESIGILTDGTGGPIHAKRSWAKNTLVQGFAIGADYIDAAWMNPEPATWRDNGIGLRCTNCQGQIFYNAFRRNDVGLHMVTIPPGEPQVGQLDINSNDFGTVDKPADSNLAAVQWDRCVGNFREFNHNDLFLCSRSANPTTCPAENTIAFRVETDPFVYVEGDTAYHSAVAEAGNSFADVEVCRDGVCTTYDTAAFTAKGAVCP